MRRGVRGESRLHRPRPVGCGADQLRHQPGLRQVLPVFARHFRRHRRDHQTGRVEDAGEIGPPEVLGRILRRRHHVTGHVMGQPTVDEPRRDMRRRDRPVHVAEAPREERARGLRDEMIRFEPGREGPPPRARPGTGQLAKADEGMHLVDVPPHRLFLAEKPVQRRVRPVPPAQLPVAETQEHGIGPRKPLRIIVTKRRFQRRHGLPRNPQGRWTRARDLRAAVEQIGRGVPHTPGHRIRRHASQRELARLDAPGRNCPDHRQADPPHQNRLSCSGGGAKR